jgi:hypothetical protein
MSTDLLVFGVFVLWPALAYGLHVGDAPPQNFWAATAQVEQLYKENGRVIANATMDPATATAACPNGNQVARQRTRIDGAREYLVWDLRCR